jgi:hypothetical protein
VVGDNSFEPPPNPVGSGYDAILSFQTNYLKLADHQPKPNKRKAYRPKKYVAKPARRNGKQKVHKNGKRPVQRRVQHGTKKQNQVKIQVGRGQKTDIHTSFDEGYCKFCRKLIERTLS